MESNWFYLEAGEPQGPVSLDRLVVVLVGSPDSGTVKVWCEGMAEWQDAQTIPEIKAKLPPPIPALRTLMVDAPSVSFEEASLVARLYRRLVLLVGVQIILAFSVGFANGQGPSDVWLLTRSLGSLGIFIVWVTLIVTAYQLVKRLPSRSAALTTVGLCIPWVGLVVLISLSNSAQKWCKTNGIEVGLLGPTKESLARLRQQKP